MEEKLVALGAFLEEYQQRQRARNAAKGRERLSLAMGTGPGDFEPQAQKKQRLMSAFIAEEQQTASIR